MYKAKKVYWISQIAGWLLLTALLFFASLLNPQSQNQKIEVLITLSCFFVFGVSITHLMRFSFEFTFSKSPLFRFQNWF